MSRGDPDTTLIPTRGLILDGLFVVFLLVGQGFDPATEGQNRHHVVLLSCPLLAILVIDVARLLQHTLTSQVPTI